MKRNLNTIKSFCIDKYLLVNLDITKVIVFNIPQNWVRRSEPDFFLGEEKVTQTQLTFTGPRFSLWDAAPAEFSHENGAFGALERQYSYLQL